MERLFGKMAAAITVYQLLRHNSGLNDFESHGLCCGFDAKVLRNGTGTHSPMESFAFMGVQSRPAWGAGCRVSSDCVFVCEPGECFPTARSTS